MRKCFARYTINCKRMLLLVLAFSNLYAQNMIFERVGREEGLQATIHSLFLGSRGFLWIGTESGLNRFDGYEFINFSPSASDSSCLSNSWVYDICEDKNGNLWIATENGLNLFYRINQSFRHSFETLDESLGGVINSLYDDKKGHVWVGTDDGLFAVNVEEEKLDKKQLCDTFTGMNITDINQDSQGNILIGTDNGLYIIEMGKDENVRKYFNRGITIIYTAGSQDVLLGTQEGLFVYNENSTDMKPQRYKIDQEFITGWIHAICRSSKGIIAVGTHEKGLILINQESGNITTYQNEPTIEETLPSNRIYSLLEDNTGIIWVGTYGGGLCKHFSGKKKFNSITHNPNNKRSLSHIFVRSFLVDKKNTLWVGTDGGGLNKYVESSKSYIAFKNNNKTVNCLTSNRIFSMVQGCSGDIWIGTYGGGLNRFNPETGKVRSYGHDNTDQNSLSDNRIRILMQDNPGYIWIGTDGGGLNKYAIKADTATRYCHNPENTLSISHDRVWSMVKSRTGNIWIATFGGGLNLFNPETGTFKKFSHITGMETTSWNSYLITLHESPDGILWIGTNGFGLVKFNPDMETYTIYNRDHGLNASDIYGLLEDNNGNIWMSSNNGLYKLDRKTEKITMFKKYDGIQDNEFNGGARYKSRNGEMFFGGINGFTKFFPEEIKINTYKPPVVITDFRIFNKSIMYDREFFNNSYMDTAITENKQINVSYKQNVLTFQFAALHFLHADKNRYAYQLEGFDKDWNYIDNRRYATYSNLPGGSYVFKVKAANNDDVWNEQGTSINITVKPPFWKTWIFILMLSLAIILLVLFIYRFRTQNMYKRQKDLEKLVQDKTKTITLANTELEKIYSQAQKKAVHMEILNKIGRTLTDDLDIGMLLDRTVIEIRKTFDYFHVAILLVDKRSNRIILQALSSAEPEKHLHTLELSIGEGMIGRTVLLGETQYASNVEKNKHYIKVKNETIKSELDIPLQTGDDIVGVISIQSDRYDAFSREDIDTMETLSSQISGAIKNAKLYKQAQDELIVRKQTEKMLRISEEKYRYLVENIKDVIISITDGDVISYINQAVEPVLEYAPSDLVGKNFQDLVYEADQNTFNDNYCKLKDGSFLTMECRMRRGNGSVCWIMISAKPIEENGVISGFHGVLTDITTKKQLENRLLQSQKLESIGQLAAGIAHEINTPAQYVDSNIYFLKESFSELLSSLTCYRNITSDNKICEAEPVICARLQEIEKNIDFNFILNEIPDAIDQSLDGIKRISNIVRAMKDFSHPGSKEKIPVDINKALQTTITVARNEWKYIAEIQTDFYTDLPNVFCLQDECNQVYLNMIINAAHAIEGTVKEGSGEKGLITITTAKRNSFVEIRISDTGAGIPEEIHDKIFDPFFTTKETGKGTGQGLAISYDVIVKKHNGKISFESEKNKGTTFIISLPSD